MSETETPAAESDPAAGKPNNADGETSGGSSSYKSEDPRVRRLVRSLDYLARTSDSISSSRAALAELRQAIKDPLRGAKHVVPHLGAENRDDEAWFYRIASLFAMHRKHQSGVSLGTAFRIVSGKRGSESIEGRFTALISSSSDQLFDHLLRAITLLKADEQPLDWCKLLVQIQRWDWPDKYCQRDLAYDYYRAADTDDTEIIDEASSSAL